MRNRIIFVTILSLISSCDLYHLILTKEEKNETKEDVDAYLLKKRFKYDESVLMNDSMYFLRKTNDYIFSSASGIASYIEVRVFDSSGAYYTSFSQCNNDFAQDNFIAGMPLKKNEKPYLNDSLSLKKELILFSLSDCKKEEVLLEASKHKYTFVVYWTIWTNYFSRKVLKEIKNYKNQYPDESYVILCNSARDKVVPK